jgi:hypothetical protein
MLVFLLVSCLSAPDIASPLLGGTNSAGEKIYFSGDSGSIRETLRHYAATYDISTKEGQIDYLLMRLKTTGYQLERNGARHTVEQAAEFLRWKMERPRWQGKVGSAEDFVNIICAGSATSGKPYVAILPDGRHDLAAIFRNELELLQEFLAASPAAAETSTIPEPPPAGQAEL